MDILRFSSYLTFLFYYYLLVLPTPLKFTATPLNSSTVTLKINNHVEDERYHVGFLVKITSYYLIDSLLIHHHFVKYFKTGRLRLYLFNLSPYKIYEITLWSSTHQGIGPRGKQIIHTPIDGMSLFWTLCAKNMTFLLCS